MKNNKNNLNTFISNTIKTISNCSVTSSNLLFNNNDYRQYTKNEATFGNNNNSMESCVNCKHSDPNKNINNSTCNITDIEVRTVGRLVYKK